jgi:hypothetical protein
MLTAQQRTEAMERVHAAVTAAIAEDAEALHAAVTAVTASEDQAMPAVLGLVGACANLVDLVADLTGRPEADVWAGYVAAWQESAEQAPESGGVA